MKQSVTQHFFQKCLLLLSEEIPVIESAVALSSPSRGEYKEGFSSTYECFYWEHHGFSHKTTGCFYLESKASSLEVERWCRCSQTF